MTGHRKEERDGLDAAFEQFVVERSPALLRTAYLLVGDHGHAEDLLQVALWRTARRWRNARIAPEHYARRVLVNLARDRWRSLGRRPRETSLNAGIGARAAISFAEQVADRDALVQALLTLPARQRAVVILRFWEGLSVAETAALLRCSEGTVKSYTSRALPRLRELLTPRPNKRGAPC